MDVFRDCAENGPKKIYEIQALYNTDTTLEFVIQPDRDYVFANDIYLHFSVHIDKHYIMDNQADKLFDSVEIIINNEKITSRSNANEYFLSSYFRTKSNHPMDHFNNILRPAGWFNGFNYNANEIIALKMPDDMTEYEIKKGNALDYRLYHYYMQINTPLFLQTKPLPSDIPIQINFKRSQATLAVLKVEAAADTTYANSQVALINPYLEITAFTSENYKNKFDLSKGPISYPVESDVIRTHVMDRGITHATFGCTTGGKLPIKIFTGLIDPVAFQGDVEKCATSFRRYGMHKIELFVDNKPLPGSQINVSQSNFIDAYTKFHRQCKFIPNNFAGKQLTLNEFTQTNFITAYDMSNITEKTGWLSVQVDFEENLTEKVMLIVYMVFEKTITFDKDRCVTMT